MKNGGPHVEQAVEERDRQTAKQRKTQEAGQQWEYNGGRYSMYLPKFQSAGIYDSVVFAQVPKCGDL